MSDSTTPSSRPSTPIDAIAEKWVVTLADLDPDVANWVGIPGRLGEYADYSPAGHEAQLAAGNAVIAELEAAAPVDEVDVATKTDLLAELRLSAEAHAAKLHERDVNVIASPAQGIREVFDLMPTATEGDWATIAEKLGNVPGAVAGYIETLRQGIADGVVPARRQVIETATGVRRHADPLGFFFDFTSSAALEGGGELPGSLKAELKKGAEASADAYAQLAEFFELELAPKAGEQDGVGRDIYALQSRRFLGAQIDFDETYEWGIDELARMVEEQTRIAGEIVPGASVEEAVAFLEADESNKLHGTEALQRWMQELSDRAVAELSATHFDIPDPVKKLECMIAPTQEGGIYYTSPNDDFSRPGRMWWSVPEGVTEFDTWRETTTVYHEGVPGHHLQLGQAVYNRAMLNTWRRSLAGTSGHAEGWALYAERLMDELGYLEKPADRLGMLDGQRMRAARVVLDIGVHLGKPNLDGSGAWTADDALTFMRANVNMNDSFIRFEVNRYLGWPGQAPSYKVGQRIWEQLRDEVKRREGAAWNIKAFHKRALDLGGVGLDTLRASLLGA
ncbi:DUF885 domain-containing protein [Lysinimonas soli]|uniref:DUF885 domain-containing protein n=1 Tax=Lysinimonas soli TaxID=1074233 RepID=A0ABW0NNP4_9MICO